MVFVRRLLWDLWNVSHIAQHGVTVDDVEEACARSPLEYETYAGRLRLVGRNAAGNLLTIIVAPTPDDGVYYTVTARPAAKKEQQLYREARGEL